MSSGSAMTSSRVPVERRSRSRSRSGWGSTPARSAHRRSSRPTRSAASGTSWSCSTRAATRSTTRPFGRGRPSASGPKRKRPSSRARRTSSAGTRRSPTGSATGSAPAPPNGGRCWSGIERQRPGLGDGATQREALLDRYGAVMLDVVWALFEIELHRHPDRRPNDVWTELTTDGLGIEPHPEWSWWAIRGQLVEQPGYMANYALSAIAAAAVRGRTRAVRGSWLEGDPGWYRFMSDGLFAAGASRSPADLLEGFLGGPLTADPLLDDLRRG